ncbi:MAG: Xaa-Pro aminopeptidase [Firmicutes bacterium]|nr:Xaa-Pro aminopeptidase [Bacillota bacterium]
MTEEYVGRRSRVLSELSDGALALVFADSAPRKSGDQVYPFTVNRNFFYLTGLDREQMILMLSGRDKQATLFIPRPDPDVEKWVGRLMRADRVTAVSGIEHIRYLDEFHAHLAKILPDASELWFEVERPGWEEAPGTTTRFARVVAEKYPHLSLCGLSSMLRRMRKVKSAHELSEIRRAIELTSRGIARIWQQAHPQMYEYELEAEFRYELARHGVRDPGFSTIVAAGDNGVILHYVENSAVVADGDLVLLDLGAQVGYYSADISRTFPVSGVFSPRQRELYEVVHEALVVVTDMIRPGVTWRALNDCAKATLTDGLRQLGRITAAEELPNYYYHSVGHSLGLDVHDEVSVPDEPLVEGMVVTVEPGLYVAQERIGIRLEDDILVTAGGHEVLSSDIPRTVADVERALAGRD